MSGFSLARQQRRRALAVWWWWCILHESASLFCRSAAARAQATIIFNFALIKKYTPTTITTTYGRGVYYTQSLWRQEPSRANIIYAIRTMTTKVWASIVWCISYTERHTYFYHYIFMLLRLKSAESRLWRLRTQNTHLILSTTICEIEDMAHVSTWLAQKRSSSSSMMCESRFYKYYIVFCLFNFYSPTTTLDCIYIFIIHA